jgi:methionyl-tRNA formyltransferase
MIGTRLAHYQIVTHLGLAGMRDIYQATKPKGMACGLQDWLLGIDFQLLIPCCKRTGSLFFKEWEMACTDVSRSRQLNVRGRQILAVNNDIGCRALELFCELGLNVALVLAHQDPGPGEIVAYASAAETARRLGLPVLQPASLRDPAVLAQLAALEPEAFFSVGYGKILPPAVLGIPHFGCINLHGSYLPWYRGRFCSVWAIINGETRTGVTVHFMDEGIDTGDIIAQKVVPILSDDSAKQLYTRQMEAGYRLLRIVIAHLIAGTYERTPQPAGQGSYFHGRSFADNRIDWDQPAARIRDFVRACDFPPYPKAFTEIEGVRREIARIDVITECSRPAEVLPGALIVASSAALHVFAADCAVRAWDQSYFTQARGRGIQRLEPDARAG